jgi:hypothetical protein
MFVLEEAESGSVRVNWLGQSEVSAKDILATPQTRSTPTPGAKRSSS